MKLINTITVLLLLAPLMFAQAELAVTVTTEPAGAELFINGKPYGTSSSLRLKPGVYELRTELSGYKTVTRTITVSADNASFTVRLETLRPVMVEFISVPEKAAIFIDGFEEGMTNETLFKLPGKYSVKFVKKGYDDYTAEIEVSDEKINKVEAVLSKNAASVKVIVMPSDAIITVNGMKYFNGNEIFLDPGRHQIVFEREGYEPETRTVTASKSDQILSVTLERKTGTLRVESTTGYAEYEIRGDDGFYMKRAGNFFKLLPQSYKVTAVQQGYISETKTVVIREGQESSLSFSLDVYTPPEPLFLKSGYSFNLLGIRTVMRELVLSYYLDFTLDVEWLILAAGLNYSYGTELPEEKFPDKSLSEFQPRLSAGIRLGTKSFALVPSINKLGTQNGYGLQLRFSGNGFLEFARFFDSDDFQAYFGYYAYF